MPTRRHQDGRANPRPGKNWFAPVGRASPFLRAGVPPGRRHPDDSTDSVPSGVGPMRRVGVAHASTCIHITRRSATPRCFAFGRRRWAGPWANQPTRAIIPPVSPNRTHRGDDAVNRCGVVAGSRTRGVGAVRRRNIASRAEAHETFKLHLGTAAGIIAAWGFGENLLDR